MIKMQKANLISFSIGTDRYGQTRTNYDQDSKREIEIDIRLKNVNENQNINFVDFQYVGLTKDKNISCKDQIITDTDKYNVVYVIPSHRYYTILLNKI